MLLKADSDWTILASLVMMEAVVHAQSFISLLSNLITKLEGGGGASFILLHPRHVRAEPTSQDICPAVPVTPPSGSSSSGASSGSRDLLLGLLRCVCSQLPQQLSIKVGLPGEEVGGRQRCRSCRRPRRCPERSAARGAWVITWWRLPTVWMPMSKAAFAGNVVPPERPGSVHMPPPQPGNASKPPQLAPLEVEEEPV